MSTAAERLKIEQALFGYDEGHNLISSSVPLVPRLRQFLANVTDGSGPDSGEKSEGAYTGLPIPETNFFALFCTWAAPEMRRPGCVWSHVLLIENGDLSRVPELGALRALFVRPQKEKLAESYRNALYFDINTEAEEPIDANRAMLLLYELYRFPSKGVVVLDHTSSAWEPVIFAVWSQQWPRLRQVFTFSTWSLGDRRLLGTPFDVQIAPYSSNRLWQRSDMPTSLIEWSSDMPLLRNAGWLDEPLVDLATRDSDRVSKQKYFRQYLNRFGGDVSQLRGGFAPLVEAYRVLRDNERALRLPLIAKLFPNPTDALSLKKSILAQIIDREDSEELWAAAHFLLKSEADNAFSRVVVVFKQIAEALWRSKRAEVIALLGELSESNRGESFFDALAASLEPQDIPFLCEEQPSAISSIIQHRPVLATERAAWQMPISGQQTLWEALRKTTADPNVWSDICVAMLQNHCSFKEAETVNLAGTNVPGCILRWLSGTDVWLPTEGWRRAFAAFFRSHLNESLSPPLLAFAAWTLPSSEAAVINGCRDDVQFLADEKIDDLPSSLRTPTLFWLAGLGLKTDGRSGAVLLSAAFFRAYDVVAGSHYPGYAWELLSVNLPDVWWEPEWDRCRRLREGLGLWLRKNQSFSKTMKRLTPDEHMKWVKRLIK